MSEAKRTVEHGGYRVLVERHDGEWCASISYRREDGVHRPLMAAFALDDVGALRELYRLWNQALKGIAEAGRVAVKLRG